MPFETLASLPDHVRELSTQKQEQWRGAWNGRFADCRKDGGDMDT